MKNLLNVVELLRRGLAIRATRLITALRISHQECESLYRLYTTRNGGEPCPEVGHS